MVSMLHHALHTLPVWIQLSAPSAALTFQSGLLTLARACHFQSRLWITAMFTQHATVNESVHLLLKFHFGVVPCNISPGKFAFPLYFPSRAETCSQVLQQWFHRSTKGFTDDTEIHKDCLLHFV
jgi:hypothetical protein